MQSVLYQSQWLKSALTVIFWTFVLFTNRWERVESKWLIRLVKGHAVFGQFGRIILAPHKLRVALINFKIFNYKIKYFINTTLNGSGRRNNVPVPKHNRYSHKQLIQYTSVAHVCEPFGKTDHINMYWWRAWWTYDTHFLCCFNIVLYYCVIVLLFFKCHWRWPTLIRWELSKSVSKSAVIEAIRKCLLAAHYYLRNSKYP